MSFTNFFFCKIILIFTIFTFKSIDNFLAILNLNLLTRGRVIIILSIHILSLHKITNQSWWWSLIKNGVNIMVLIQDISWLTFITVKVCLPRTVFDFCILWTLFKVWWKCIPWLTFCTSISLLIIKTVFNWWCYGNTYTFWWIKSWLTNNTIISWGVMKTIFDFIRHCNTPFKIGIKMIIYVTMKTNSVNSLCDTFSVNYLFTLSRNILIPSQKITDLT